MNNYLSQKLKILSFILIIFVLYIHSSFHADEIRGIGLSIFYIQKFISGMLGRCAVPLFYMISGYLFFYKTPEGIKSVLEKMKKRINSLLIPYIIGCLFFVFFNILISHLPATSKFVNAYITSPFNEPFFKAIVRIFYDAGNGSPMAFQLWFLRDLIILVILSPIWYYLYKYLKWYWIPVIFILNTISMNRPIEHFPVYSLFWFSLGGALIKSKFIITVMQYASKYYITTILFLVLCILQIIYPSNIQWIYFQIPIILLGIISLWICYNGIVASNFDLYNHRWLSTACNYTFFIYLFHEPTLNIIRKIIAFIIGKNQIGYIISYLSSPFIFAFFAIIIGMLLKKILPNLYTIIIGGR
ncbi:MAG: acyltransferase [Arachidicoccus sp.]|nr:acyltransferase [Arachidicoccus sp.]